MWPLHQALGDALRVLRLPVHPQAHRRQPSVQNPALVRLENVAEQAAARADGPIQGRVHAQHDARQQVRESSQILRGGVDHHIGAEGDRMLERRTEERVVHDHRRLRIERSGGERRPLDVGHHHGRVGGRLDEDRLQPRRRPDRLVDLRRMARDDRDAADVQWLEQIVHKMLRAPIERHGVHQRVAGLEQRQQRGHDGRHSGIEYDGPGGALLERDDLVFKDLCVGVVEAGVNEVGLLAGFEFGLAREQSEGALRRFGAGEHIGRTAEHGRPGAADREAGIEAAGQNLGGRMSPLQGAAGCHSGRTSANQCTVPAAAVEP